jgi:hypothetical protein
MFTGVFLLAAASALVPLHSTGFSLEVPAEGVAEVRLRCARCDWGRPGREAAVLRLSLDGAYSQHLVAARGDGAYRVALGALAAGAHRVDVHLEPGLSCRGVGAVSVDAVAVEAVRPGDAGYDGLARAPVVHLRPDTLRRFTDLPLVVWYEEERLLAWDEEDLVADGRRLRYSIVFSNEDGGTPSDRLMATWGRVTDIEYVYGVETDAAGAARSEQYQGRDHRLLPFQGRHEAGHPLLWVSTENNMIAEEGSSTYRLRPAPVPFDLAGVSREAVMDAHPWTYRVSSAEVRREGRVRAGARPGSRLIPDPRRFAYVEACAEATHAALSFAVGVRRGGRTEWVWSDAGRAEWRISRNPDHFPNGCFRGAVALPGTRPQVVGLRFRSSPRPAREGEPAPPADAGRAVLRRVNRVFLLDETDQPRESLFRWTGELPLAPEGAPAELAID